MFVLVKARCLFVFSALLLFADGAYGGRYQLTKDGKFRVWNDQGGSKYEATWSGARGPNGYATGQGTLTWYRVERKIVTGSSIPSGRGARSVVLSRWSGKMVRGKFDGLVVNVIVNGGAFHGMFVDGSQVGEWAAGPVPGPSSPAARRDESASLRQPDATNIASDQRRDERVRRAELVEAPAEAPSPVQKSEATGSPRQIHPSADQTPEITDQPANQRNVSVPAAKETPSPATDNPLWSRISAPSLLRTKALADTSPSASVPSTTSSSPRGVARLTATEVIGLANAEALRQGYNLDEYQRSNAKYIAADETWLIIYDQKYAGGVGKFFSVSVEDKTKKTSVAAAR
jgi:hypothetical protein